MTASTSSIRNAVLLAALAGLTACAYYYEVPVETPLEPKLDVSDFQRVLVAGFVAGGSEEVDTNLETARLLRSQLRSNSEFQVIDADVLELTRVAEDQAQGTPDFETLAGNGEENGDEEESERYSEEDLEVLEHIFANASYWQELGEEHQQPLIVTGTVYFTPHQRSGLVTRQREVYDEFGRRQVAPVRAYRDRRGYILTPKFIFIDGRTGATLYTERHREEILYDASRNTPALSTYFELMDRLIPSFLGTLSAESIKGTRTLLK
jgi:hypothetical protein